jgi:hypothetical protein
MIAVPFPVAGLLHVRIWVAYVPWILVAIANIVIDVVATITFADDVSETQVSPLKHNISKVRDGDVLCFL